MAPIGARAFASTWLIYGLAEVFFGVWVPGGSALVVKGAHGLDPWVGSAVLLFWPLLGAGLGLATGAGLGLLPGNRAREEGEAGRLLLGLGSASVLAVVGLHLFDTDSFGRSGVAVFAAFSGFVVLSLRTRHWLAATGHPAVLVPTLVAWLCAVRVLFYDVPLTTRMALSAAILTAALGAARWLHRSLEAAPFLGARGTGRGTGTGIAITTVLALVSLHVFDRVPAPELPAPAARRDAAVPVIMVVLDTVRADHLSSYGYVRETDPNLARLAERATVFEHALAPGDMTLTSHASLFTGQWVASHGAVIASPELVASKTTLAELLADAGYATAGVSSNCGWIAGGKGIEQGFDYWDTRCGVSPFRGIGSAYLRTRLVALVRRRFFPERAMWEWRNAQVITDEAIRLLDQVAADGAPFLLFVNYMDVHRPIHPPRPYRERFPGQLPHFDMMHDWSALNRESLSGERTALPEERAHLISQYDGALLYMDEHLGRLFDDLEERGLLDPSLVVVLSDHGESFGSHGTFGHGASVYQDVVRVPLIVKRPGQRQGGRVATPVSLADVLPTVASVLGLPLPEGVDGQSLADPALDPARAVVSESYSGKGRQMRALLRGDRKLVERTGQAPELYDIGADPDETRDLAGSEATQTAALAADLERTLSDVEHGNGGAGLDAADIERLEALGYLERE